MKVCSFVSNRFHTFTPHPSPRFLDELFAVLDESERLLGEIDELTKQKQPKVSTK